MVLTRETLLTCTGQAAQPARWPDAVAASSRATVDRADARDGRRCARGRRRATPAESTPFISQVTIRPYMTAARRPPRSDPQNGHDFRPRATQRSPRSAALFDSTRARRRGSRRRRPPAGRRSILRDTPGNGRASSGRSRRALRRRRTACRRVGRPRVGLAFGQHRHGRVVAVQPLGRKHVGLDIAAHHGRIVKRTGDAVSSNKICPSVRVVLEPSGIGPYEEVDVEFRRKGEVCREARSPPQRCLPNRLFRRVGDPRCRGRRALCALKIRELARKPGNVEQLHALGTDQRQQFQVELRLCFLAHSVRNAPSLPRLAKETRRPAIRRYDAHPVALEEVGKFRHDVRWRKRRLSLTKCVDDHSFAFRNERSRPSSSRRHGEPPTCDVRPARCVASFYVRTPFSLPSSSYLGGRPQYYRSSSPPGECEPKFAGLAVGDSVITAASDPEIH